jgi:hypothetical protein
VAYVNTSAEVKAEADYCCTSSNAAKVISAMPADKEILFLPDMYLGAYLEKITGRKLHLWMGECHVHTGIRAGAHPCSAKRSPGGGFAHSFGMRLFFTIHALLGRQGKPHQRYADLVRKRYRLC